MGRYKIVKNVYIGTRVRVSGGDGTVKFKNEPMSGVVIKKANSDGYILSHPDLPKDVQLDWDQLPVIDLKIDYGVIEDELTFVSTIYRSKSSMVLIKTKSLEYLTLLEEKSDREEKPKKINKKKLTEREIIIKEKRKSYIDRNSWKGLKRDNYIRISRGWLRYIYNSYELTFEKGIDYAEQCKAIKTSVHGYDKVKGEQYTAYLENDFLDERDWKKLLARGKKDDDKELRDELKEFINLVLAKAEIPLIDEDL